MIAPCRLLLEVLQIACFDIFPLCMAVQQAIIEYQVHKLLFNLTCVLEAINTRGAEGGLHDCRGIKYHTKSERIIVSGSR